MQTMLFFLRQPRSQVSINNIPALVQIKAWRRSGDKPFSEPMMVRLLTHISVTRPQRVKMSFTWQTSAKNKYSFGRHIVVTSAYALGETAWWLQLQPLCGFVHWYGVHDRPTPDVTPSVCFMLSVTSYKLFMWCAGTLRCWKRVGSI